MTVATIHDTVNVHPDVVWREIDGEVVLLNVVTGLYYGLDDVGSTVWRRLAQHPAPLQAIRDGLLADYDADASTMGQDLIDLVAKLTEAQLVVVSSADSAH